jgi:UDP-GlcNAc:undecaprenyl-phosphate GlcNAc-1-phosphate transferase
VRDYILTLLVAAAVTYLLTPLVRRLAIRAGAMFEPRARDVHTVPVPRMGGLAMYGGLAAGLLVAEQIPQLRQAFGPTGMVSGLLLAGGLLVVIGLIDDKWGMSALTKLAGQIAAGAILVATGTQLNLLPLPGGASFAPTPDQSTLLTILVVVATINAVNFIDGLDGLAAGVVTIAAASFLIYYYYMAQAVGASELAAPALASAILTGVCLGFLPHNFHPARIFMGDTGSMLLGLVLAYAPISSISSLDPALWSPRVNRYPVVLPLLLPAAILVIPYLDLLLAVIRRTRAGQSPFAADSKHLHHRLIGIGHSQRATVLVMYLWAAVFSGSIVWFSLERVPRPGAANHRGQPVLVFVVITAAAVLALVLLSVPWLRRRDQSGKPQPATAADVLPGPDRMLAPAAAPVPGGALESQPQPAASPPVRSVVGSVPPADPWLGPRSDQISWRSGPNGAAGNGQRSDPRYDPDPAGGNGHRSGPPPPDGQFSPDAGPAAGPETAPSPAVEVLRGRED